MKIKIAHLYYDLLNLYGENGNVLALKKHLENSGFDVEIRFFTIDDVIDFKSYDVYYIGSGSDDNQTLVIKDIYKYRKAIKVAIENNKCFIATGNAYELFGKYIEDLDEKKLETLNIFEYFSKRIDFRIIGEQVYKTKLISNPIIGFQNRSSIIKNSDNNLFKVIDGTGYEPNNNFEGYQYKNFYGTYLLGPILIRNPYFTDYILSNLFKDYIANKNTLEYKAYHEFINNFVKETI